MKFEISLKIRHYEISFKNFKIYSCGEKQSALFDKKMQSDRALAIARSTRVPAQLVLLCVAAGPEAFLAVVKRWAALEEAHVDAGGFHLLAELSPVQAARDGSMHILAEMKRQNVRSCLASAHTVRLSIDIEARIDDIRAETKRHSVQRKRKGEEPGEGKNAKKAKTGEQAKTGDEKARNKLLASLCQEKRALKAELEILRSSVVNLSPGIAVAASAAGHPHIVQWAIENIVNFPLKECVHAAASGGHFSVVRLLFHPDVLFRYSETEKTAADFRAIDAALARGGREAFDLVRFLCEKTGSSCTTRGVDAAARNPESGLSVDLFAWIYRKFGLLPSWDSIVAQSSPGLRVSLAEWRSRFRGEEP